MMRSPSDADDLGALVDSAEARSAAILQARDGSARLAVCARGWVLIVDPLTGSSTQVALPNDSYPFSGLGTHDGTFITAGSRYGIEAEAEEEALCWLSEVDPLTEEVRSVSACPGEELLGLAFAEDPDGGVWFSTYPSALVVRWDRRMQTFSEPIRVSDTEQYPSHLAVDRHGWVYAGVGTTTRSIVAIPPGASAGTTLLLDERAGSGYVRLGLDGEVYGHVDATEMQPVEGAPAYWWRFEAGKMFPVEEPAPSEYRGRSFDRIHGRDPEAWSLVELNLAEHRLVTTHPEVRTTPLEYRSAGAKLSPFRMGPTGRIHGTSNHPLQLFDADPLTGEAVVHGLAPVEEARGNICAWAPWRDLMIGVAYVGGHLYLLDPAAEVSAGSNPAHLGRFEEVGRPRCALVAGDTLVWGGYSDYGGRGGGIVVTDLPTRTSTVLTHDEVVPGQSTTALTLLGPGVVLGATSIENPGGAPVTAAAAEVYQLDVVTRTVTDRFTPVEGVETWSGAATSPDGLVHLVSFDGLHALIDPATQQTVEILARIDLGNMAVGGCFLHEGAMWTVQQRGITRVDLTTHEVEQRYLSDRPLTSGGVVNGDDVLVGAGSHLLRVRGIA